MGKFFMQVCRDNGLKVQRQHLFARLTLPEFLKGKVCFLVLFEFLNEVFCVSARCGNV